MKVFSSPIRCFYACESRPPAPRTSRSLGRFAAALCTLLQQWISAAATAAGSHRRAARWQLALPCPSPGMFSARPLCCCGSAAGSVKGGAATERSEACP